MLRIPDRPENGKGKDSVRAALQRKPYSATMPRMVMQSASFAGWYANLLR